MGEVVDLEAERKARADVRARREKALRDAEGPRRDGIRPDDTRPPDGAQPSSRPDDSDPTRPGRGGETTPR